MAPARSEPHSAVVVDDSPFFRRLLTDILERDGEFRVAATARNGEDAIRKVHRVSPDVLLMDLEMPGRSGFAALQRILERPRPPRVVVVTLHSDEDRRSLAILLSPRKNVFLRINQYYGTINDRLR